MARPDTGRVDTSLAGPKPLPKVAEFIRQAIQENDEVLETPPPGVRFWDFGESSLVFWGWYWADVQNPMGIWDIQSEIRFRIVELFRENSITIAITKRDVHLDTPEAINVQLAKVQAGTDVDRQGPDVSDGRADRRADDAAQEELKPEGEDGADEQSEEQSGTS